MRLVNWEWNTISGFASHERLLIDLKVMIPCSDPVRALYLAQIHCVALCVIELLYKGTNARTINQ